MELATGTRVGPYEIERVIGAGGMGVVYRALDARLGRQVAIKVLPVAVKDDADRMRRFEQEARTIGGLNHPNLVTLHDVGHHDGVPYLVTELLDGQSLRARIEGGALPLREIVQDAMEIAKGLAAAHGAGVVHRDIKPDNIFVTREGRVKILDFGIAKLKRDEDDKSDVGSAATIGATAATGTGVVIGTPGYMAPEQLGGGAIDARTDIFAFGVVLYEMLTRKRPFAAPTGIEESYAVMKSPPTALPPKTPAALSRIVLRCLEKRPEDRFQSASDLAFALGALDEVSTGRISEASVAVAETLPVGMAPIAVSPSTAPAPAVPAVTATSAPPRGISLSTKLLIGLCITAATGVAIMWIRHKPPSVVVTRPAKPALSWPALVEGGPVYHRVSFHAQAKWHARFAADGQSILYSVKQGDDWQVMRADISRPSLLPVGVKGKLLDVSPAGELAVRLPTPNETGGILATVVPGTGAPRTRAEAVSDAAWGPDGELAISRSQASGPSLEYPIGTVIAHQDTGAIMFPRVSRDKRIAYVETPAPPDTRGRLIVRDANSKPTDKPLIESPYFDGIEGVAWSPDAHEVWFSTGELIRAIDLDGHMRVLVRGQLRMQLRDVSADGRLLVAPTDVRSRLFAGPPQGSLQDLGWLDSSVIQSVSRDGSVLAFLQGTGLEQSSDGYAVYVRTRDQPPFRIGFAYGVELLPDATAAILMSATSLRRVPTTVGKPSPIPLGRIAQLDLADFLSVSPNGRYLVVRAAESGKPMRLWRIDLNGGEPEPVGPPAIEPAQHPITSDGAWIAIAQSHGIKLVSTTGKPDHDLPSDRLEEPIELSDDGKKVFTIQAHGWPRQLIEIDIASNKRTQLRTFDPVDRPRGFDIAMSSDGSTVAYSSTEESSDLYVIEPPKPEPKR